MWWKAWHGWTRREEHQKSSNDEWMIFCLFFAFTSFLVFECSSFCNWENLLRSFDEWKQSNIINNKMKYKFSVYRREVTNLTDGKYWSERRTFVFLCEATTRKKQRKTFLMSSWLDFFLFNLFPFSCLIYETEKSSWCTFQCQLSSWLLSLTRISGRWWKFFHV